MLYTTKQLYGTERLTQLSGEIPYIEERIQLLEASKTRENAKPTAERDDHLIKKIIDAQDHWRDRIKEIR